MHARHAVCTSIFYKSSLTLKYINIELRAPARCRPARPRGSSGAKYQGFALVTGVLGQQGFAAKFSG
jgi:hypothetical protein